MEILGMTLSNVRPLDAAHYESSISRLTGYSKGGPAAMLSPNLTVGAT